MIPAFRQTGILLLLLVSDLQNPARAQESNRPSDEIPRLRELDFKPLTDSPLKLNEARTRQIADLVREATVPDLQDALKAGTVTCEELTLYFLERIRRYDGELRSYIEINPLCLAEARAADRVRTAGTVPGPLHGIPINLKDNIGTTAPMHTTAGAEILLNHAPAKDADLVTLLRAEGAVILGKAALSELAGVLTTEPPGYNAVSGIGVNPYKKGLPVSGSSSGSAISTSAFLTMVSVGTETSGSLISPASMNGVVAMKPSLGVVSGRGVLPLIRFQDSAGPITRCVTDAAILLSIIADQHQNYPASLNPKALEGVAVGIIRSDITGPKDSAKNAHWLKLIDDGLEKTKTVRRDVRLEGKIDLLPVIFLGLAQETIGYLRAAGAPVKTLADLQTYNAAKPGTRIPRGQNMIEFGSRMVAAFYKEKGLKEDEAAKTYENAALKAREAAAAILSQAFTTNQVDLLVSLSNNHSEFYATAGYPAITVPLGLDQDGAPNGVTFIGKRGEDAKLLAHAFAFEQATRYRINPTGVLKDQ